MNVIVTSGGVKVPLDPVRDITNLSKGTFGAKLAKGFLDEFHDVHFFCAKNSRTPFRFEQQFFEIAAAAESIPHEHLFDYQKRHAIWLEWCARHGARYQETEYRNFDDYRSGLEELIKEKASFGGRYERPDVILLAAAVSDFIADSTDEKARSKDELTIQLRPAEKIISRVKEWAPDAVLVGFKLLVGCTKEELVKAAVSSIETNGCDLVIANDLNSLKAGNHQVLLVDKYEAEEIPGAAVQHIVSRIEGLVK
jgi:phosphopantothenoylcysteine synthetase/decarboxylase